MVNPSFPAKTGAEFIAYAKANPGKINFGSAGTGSVAHVSGELFKMMAGVDMQHVPYRGAPLALADLLGGQVQVMFDNLPSSIDHIRGGPPARARRLDAAAARAAARRADDRRVRAGLRDHGLRRPRRAGRHAARDRRQAQQGRRQRARRRRRSRRRSSTSAACRCR